MLATPRSVGGVNVCRTDRVLSTYLATRSGAAHRADFHVAVAEGAAVSKAILADGPVTDPPHPALSVVVQDGVLRRVQSRHVEGSVAPIRNEVVDAHEVRRWVIRRVAEDEVVVLACFHRRRGLEGEVPEAVVVTGIATDNRAARARTLVHRRDTDDVLRLSQDLSTREVLSRSVIFLEGDLKRATVTLVVVAVAAHLALHEDDVRTH